MPEPIIDTDKEKKKPPVATPIENVDSYDYTAMVMEDNINNEGLFLVAKPTDRYLHVDYPTFQKRYSKRFDNEENMKKAWGIIGEMRENIFNESNRDRSKSLGIVSPTRIAEINQHPILQTYTEHYDPYYIKGVGNFPDRRTSTIQQQTTDSDLVWNKYTGKKMTVGDYEKNYRGSELYAAFFHPEYDLSLEQDKTGTITGEVGKNYWEMHWKWEDPRGKTIRSVFGDSEFNSGTLSEVTRGLGSIYSDARWAAGAALSTKNIVEGTYNLFVQAHKYTSKGLPPPSLKWEFQEDDMLDAWSYNMYSKAKSFDLIHESDAKSLTYQVSRGIQSSVSAILAGGGTGWLAKQLGKQAAKKGAIGLLDEGASMMSDVAAARVAREASINIGALTVMGHWQDAAMEMGISKEDAVFTSLLGGIVTRWTEGKIGPSAIYNFYGHKIGVEKMRREARNVINTWMKEAGVTSAAMLPKSYYPKMVADFVQRARKMVYDASTGTFVGKVVLGVAVPEGLEESTEGTVHNTIKAAYNIFKDYNKGPYFVRPDSGYFDKDFTGADIFGDIPNDFLVAMLSGGVTGIGTQAYLNSVNGGQNSARHNAIIDFVSKGRTDELIGMVVDMSKKAELASYMHAPNGEKIFVDDEGNKSAQSSNDFMFKMIMADIEMIDDIHKTSGLNNQTLINEIMGGDPSLAKKALSIQVDMHKTKNEISKLRETEEEDAKPVKDLNARLENLTKQYDEILSGEYAQKKMREANIASYILNDRKVRLKDLPHVRSMVEKFYGQAPEEGIRKARIAATEVAEKATKEFDEVIPNAIKHMKAGIDIFTKSTNIKDALSSLKTMGVSIGEFGIPLEIHTALLPEIEKRKVEMVNEVMPLLTETEKAEFDVIVAENPMLDASELLPSFIQDKIKNQKATDVIAGYHELKNIVIPEPGLKTPPLFDEDKFIEEYYTTLKDFQLTNEKGEKISDENRAENIIASFEKRDISNDESSVGTLNSIKIQLENLELFADINKNVYGALDKERIGFIDDKSLLTGVQYDNIKRKLKSLNKRIDDVIERNNLARINRKNRQNKIHLSNLEMHEEVIALFAEPEIFNIPEKENSKFRDALVAFEVAVKKASDFDVEYKSTLKGEPYDEKLLIDASKKLRILRSLISEYVKGERINAVRNKIYARVLTANREAFSAQGYYNPQEYDEKDPDDLFNKNTMSGMMPDTEEINFFTFNLVNYLQNLNRLSDDVFFDHYKRVVDKKTKDSNATSYEQEQIIQHVVSWYEDSSQDFIDHFNDFKLKDPGGNVIGETNVGPDKKGLQDSIVLRGVASAGKTSEVLTMIVDVINSMHGKINVVVVGPTPQVTAKLAESVKGAEGVEGVENSVTKFNDKDSFLESNWSTETDLVVFDEASLIGTKMIDVIKDKIIKNKENGGKTRFLFMGDQNQMMDISENAFNLPILVEAERTITMNEPYRTGSVDNWNLRKGLQKSIHGIAHKKPVIPDTEYNAEQTLGVKYYYKDDKDGEDIVSNFLKDIKVHKRYDTVLVVETREDRAKLINDNGIDAKTAKFIGVIVDDKIFSVQGLDIARVYVYLRPEVFNKTDGTPNKQYFAALLTAITRAGIPDKGIGFTAMYNVWGRENGSSKEGNPLNAGSAKDIRDNTVAVNALKARIAEIAPSTTTFESAENTTFDEAEFKKLEKKLRDVKIVKVVDEKGQRKYKIGGSEELYEGVSSLLSDKKEYASRDNKSPGVYTALGTLYHKILEFHVKNKVLTETQKTEIASFIDIYNKHVDSFNKRAKRWKAKNILSSEEFIKEASDKINAFLDGIGREGLISEVVIAGKTSTGYPIGGTVDLIKVLGFNNGVPVIKIYDLKTTSKTDDKMPVEVWKEQTMVYAELLRRGYEEVGLPAFIVETVPNSKIPNVSIAIGKIDKNTNAMQDIVEKQSDIKDEEIYDTALSHLSTPVYLAEGSKRVNESGGYAVGDVYMSKDGLTATEITGIVEKTANGKKSIIIETEDGENSMLSFHFSDDFTQPELPLEWSDPLPSRGLFNSSAIRMRDEGLLVINTAAAIYRKEYSGQFHEDNLHQQVKRAVLKEVQNDTNSISRTKHSAHITLEKSLVLYDEKGQKPVEYKNVLLLRLFNTERVREAVKKITGRDITNDEVRAEHWDVMGVFYSPNETASGEGDYTTVKAIDSFTDYNELGQVEALKQRIANGFRKKDSKGNDTRAQDDNYSELTAYHMKLVDMRRRAAIGEAQIVYLKELSPGRAVGYWHDGDQSNKKKPESLSDFKKRMGKKGVNFGNPFYKEIVLKDGTVTPRLVIAASYIGRADDVIGDKPKSSYIILSSVGLTPKDINAIKKSITHIEKQDLEGDELEKAILKSLAYKTIQFNRSFLLGTQDGRRTSGLDEIKGMQKNGKYLFLSPYLFGKNYKLGLNDFYNTPKKALENLRSAWDLIERDFNNESSWSQKYMKALVGIKYDERGDRLANDPDDKRLTVRATDFFYPQLFVSIPTTKIEVKDSNVNNIDDTFFNEKDDGALFSFHMSSDENETSTEETGYSQKPEDGFKEHDDVDERMSMANVKSRTHLSYSRIGIMKGYVANQWVKLSVYKSDISFDALTMPQAAEELYNDIKTLFYAKYQSEEKEFFEASAQDIEKYTQGKVRRYYAYLLSRNDRFVFDSMIANALPGIDIDELKKGNTKIKKRAQNVFTDKMNAQSNVSDSTTGFVHLLLNAIELRQYKRAETEGLVYEIAPSIAGEVRNINFKILEKELLRAGAEAQQRPYPGQEGMAEIDKWRDNLIHNAFTIADKSSKAELGETSNTILSFVDTFLGITNITRPSEYSHYYLLANARSISETHPERIRHINDKINASRSALSSVFSHMMATSNKYMETRLYRDNDGKIHRKSFFPKTYSYAATEMRFKNGLNSKINILGNTLNDASILALISDERKERKYTVSATEDNRITIVDKTDGKELVEINLSGSFFNNFKIVKADEVDIRQMFRFLGLDINKRTIALLRNGRSDLRGFNNKSFDTDYLAETLGYWFALSQNMIDDSFAAGIEEYNRNNNITSDIDHEVFENAVPVKSKKKRGEKKKKEEEIEIRVKPSDHFRMVQDLARLEEFAAGKSKNVGYYSKVVKGSVYPHTPPSYLHSLLQSGEGRDGNFDVTAGVKEQYRHELETNQTYWREESPILIRDDSKPNGYRILQPLKDIDSGWIISNAAKRLGESIVDGGSFRVGEEPEVDFVRAAMSMWIEAVQKDSTEQSLPMISHTMGGMKEQIVYEHRLVGKQFISGTGKDVTFDKKFVIEKIVDIMDYHQNALEQSVDRWRAVLDSIGIVVSDKNIDRFRDVYQWDVKQGNPLAALLVSRKEITYDVLREAINKNPFMVKNRDYKDDTENQIITIGNHTSFNNSRVINFHSYKTLKSANKKEQWLAVEDIFFDIRSKLMGGIIDGKYFKGYLREIHYQAEDGDFMGTGTEELRQKNVFKRPKKEKVKGREKPFKRYRKAITDEQKEYQKHSIPNQTQMAIDAFGEDNVSVEETKDGRTIIWYNHEYTEYEYNPYYEGFMYFHYISDFWTSQLLQGDIHQYEGTSDWFKRSIGQIAPGTVAINGTTFSLPKTGTVLISDDLLGRVNAELTLIGYTDKEAEYKTDDGMAQFSALAREMLHIFTGGVAGNMGTTVMDKFVYYDKDQLSELAVYAKMANLHNSGDMIANSPILEAFEKSMMSEQLWNELTELRTELKSELGVVLKKALSWDEAIKKLANDIILDNRHSEYHLMLAPLSTIKLGQQSVNRNPFETNQFQAFGTQRTVPFKYKNFRLQNNPEHLVSESSGAKIPKQFLIHMGILPHNAERIEKINDIQNSNATELWKSLLDEFKDKSGVFSREIFHDFIRKKGIRHSERMTAVGNFAILINDPSKRMSVELPQLLTTLKHMFINAINDDMIHPEMSAIRVIQVSGHFFPIYDSLSGRRYMHSEVAKMTPEQKTKLGISEPRELHAQGFMDDKGRDVFDIARDTNMDPKSVFNALEAAGTLRVRAAEIIISFPFIDYFAEKMGISSEDFKRMSVNEIRDAMSKDILLSLQFENELKMILERNPSSSTSSGFKAEVVGFMNDIGSVVFLSSKKNVIDGTDYDIDTLTSYHYDPIQKEGVHEKVRNNNNAMMDLFHDYFDDARNIKVFMSIIDMRKLKAKAKLRENENIYSDVYDFSTNGRYYAFNSDGNQMISYMAVIANTYSGMSQAHSIALRRDPEFRGYTKFHLNYKTGRSRDGSLTINDLSSLLNAATDNPKLLILGIIKANPVTANYFQALAAQGYSLDEMLEFVEDKKFRELNKIFQKVKESYSLDSETFDRFEILDITEKRIATLKDDLTYPIHPEEEMDIQERLPHLEKFLRDLYVGEFMYRVGQVWSVNRSKGINVFDHERKRTTDNTEFYLGRSVADINNKDFVPDDSFWKSRYKYMLKEDYDRFVRHETVIRRQGDITGMTRELKHIVTYLNIQKGIDDIFADSFVVNSKFVQDNAVRPYLESNRQDRFKYSSQEYAFQNSFEQYIYAIYFNKEYAHKPFESLLSIRGESFKDDIINIGYPQGRFRYAMDFPEYFDYLKERYPDAFVKSTLLNELVTNNIGGHNYIEMKTNDVGPEQLDDFRTQLKNIDILLPGEDFYNRLSAYIFSKSGFSYTKGGIADLLDETEFRKFSDFWNTEIVPQVFTSNPSRIVLDKYGKNAEYDFIDLLKDVFLEDVYHYDIKALVRKYNRETFFGNPNLIPDKYWRERHRMMQIFLKSDKTSQMREAKLLDIRWSTPYSNKFNFFNAIKSVSTQDVVLKNISYETLVKLIKGENATMGFRTKHNYQDGQVHLPIDDIDKSRGIITNQPYHNDIIIVANSKNKVTDVGDVALSIEENENEYIYNVSLGMSDNTNVMMGTIISESKNIHSKRTASYLFEASQKLGLESKRVIFKTQKEIQDNALSFLKGEELEYVKKHIENGGKINGFYEHKTKNTILDSDLLLKPDKLEGVFLHEFVHRLTLGAIDNPKTEAEIIYSQKINEIFNHAKDFVSRHPELRKVYGFTKAREMVAEAYANRHYQKILSSIKTGNNKTLWQQILEAFRDFISSITGLSKAEIDGSLLEQLMKTTEDYFNSGVKNLKGVDLILNNEKFKIETSPSVDFVRSTSGNWSFEVDGQHYDRNYALGQDPNEYRKAEYYKNVYVEPENRENQDIAYESVEISLNEATSLSDSGYANPHYVGISKEEFDAALEEYKKIAPNNEFHKEYSTGIVTDYKIIEFITPEIIPNRKAHFINASDNNIGWVRTWKNGNNEFVVGEIQSEIFATTMGFETDRLSRDYGYAKDPSGESDESKNEKENFLKSIQHNWKRVSLQLIINYAIQNNENSILLPTPETSGKIQKNNKAGNVYEQYFNIIKKEKLNWEIVEREGNDFIKINLSKIISSTTGINRNSIDENSGISMMLQAVPENELGRLGGMLIGDDNSFLAVDERNRVIKGVEYSLTLKDEVSYYVKNGPTIKGITKANMLDKIDKEILPMFSDFDKRMPENFTDWLKAGAKIEAAEDHFGSFLGSPMYDEATLEALKEEHFEYTPGDVYMQYTELKDNETYKHLYDPAFEGINPIVIIHHPDDSLVETIDDKKVQEISIFNLTSKSINDNAEKDFLPVKFISNSRAAVKDIKSLKSSKRGISDFQLALTAMNMKLKTPNVRIRKLGTLSIGSKGMESSYDAYMPDLVKEIKALSEIEDFYNKMPETIQKLLSEKKIYEPEQYEQNYGWQLKYMYYNKALHMDLNEGSRKEFFGNSKRLYDVLKDDSLPHREVDYIKYRLHYLETKKFPGLDNEKTKLNNKEYKLLSGALREFTSSRVTRRNAIRDIDWHIKWGGLPMNVDNDIFQWAEKIVVRESKIVQHEMMEFQKKHSPLVEKLRDVYFSMNSLMRTAQVTVDTSDVPFKRLYKKLMVRDVNDNLVEVDDRVIHYDINDPKTKEKIRLGELHEDEVAEGAFVVKVIREQKIENLIHKIQRERGYVAFTNEEKEKLKAEATKEYYETWEDGMIPVIHKKTITTLFSGDFKNWRIKMMKQFEEDASFFDQDHKEEKTELNLEIANRFMSQMGKPNTGGDSRRLELMGLVRDDKSGEIHLRSRHDNEDMSSDLEFIMNYFLLASKRKIRFENNVLPVLNSAKTLLYNIKQEKGQATPRMLEYLELWKNRIVFGKTLKTHPTVDALNNMSLKLAVYQGIALNVPVAITSGLLNTYSLFTTAIANSIGGHRMYGIKDLFFVVKMLFTPGGQAMFEALGKMYQVTMTGTRDLMSSPLHVVGTRNFGFQSHWAFWMNFITDYEARLIAMAAQMHKDGSLDAYTLNKTTRELIYDEKKDRQYWNADGTRTKEQIILKEYTRQRLIEEGLQNPDDEKLARGYDDQLARNLKHIGDQLIGGYDAFTDPNAQSHALGRHFGLYRKFFYMKGAELYTSGMERSITGNRIVVDGKVYWNPEYYEGKTQTFMLMVREWKTLGRKDSKFWQNLTPRQKVNIAKLGSDILLFVMLFFAYKLPWDDEDEKNSIKDGKGRKIGVTRIGKSFQYAYMDLVNELNPNFYIDMLHKPFNSVSQIKRVADMAITLMQFELPKAGIVMQSVPGAATIRMAGDIKASFEK